MSIERLSSPTDHTIANQYVDGTYRSKVPDWHAGDSPWKAVQVLRVLTKNGLSVTSVCDIGCGVGEVLVELQKNLAPETSFTGFDISPQAISIAKLKENGKLAFYNGDFFSHTEPVPDLLLLLDVFEHVRDYIGFLDALRKRAAWVIFHIPIDVSVQTVIGKSSWMLHMRQQYGHLHYFTKETALATLGDMGYKIVDYLYTDDMEISEAHVPKAPIKRIYYEIRRFIFRFNQDLSSGLFAHYNLMVLAQGDRSGPLESIRSNLDRCREQ